MVLFFFYKEQKIGAFGLRDGPGGLVLSVIKGQPALGTDRSISVQGNAAFGTDQIEFGAADGACLSIGRNGRAAFGTQ